MLKRKFSVLVGLNTLVYVGLGFCVLVDIYNVIWKESIMSIVYAILYLTIGIVFWYWNRVELDQYLAEEKKRAIRDLGSRTGVSVAGLTEQMEKKLLEFFGSQEDLIRYSHLYVLEAEPMVMEVMSDYDIDTMTNTYLCQASTKIRIRIKTPVELEADRVD